MSKFYNILSFETLIWRRKIPRFFRYIITNNLMIKCFHLLFIQIVIIWLTYFSWFFFFFEVILTVPAVQILPHNWNYRHQLYINFFSNRKYNYNLIFSTTFSNQNFPYIVDFFSILLLLMDEVFIGNFVFHL